MIAFILNLSFSVFEFIGGFLTGSVAILTDAIHDIGDTIGIAASWVFERISKKQPDHKYSYGYGRFSVLGGAVTTCLLLISSLVVIYHSILRIITPKPIDYNGMIIFAVVGLCVNGVAAFVTRQGDSLNQKAVNLHMLEDVLGWAVVLVGGIVMRFTDLWILDPLMSLCIALVIFFIAMGNMKEVVDLFLMKVPTDMDVEELKNHIGRLEGVQDVHHIHVWSLDGCLHYVTMHIVTSGDAHKVKAAVREELKEHGIFHVTLELESPEEPCPAKTCVVEYPCNHQHHGHHH